MRKILGFCFIMLLSPELCQAGVVVVGELTQDKSLLPGEKIEGSIQLENDGTTPCQVRVYQTDYWFSADGSNLYGQPGSTTRSNAGWFSVSPNRLTIPPHQRAWVYYSGRVPPGTEWASIQSDLQGTESGSLSGTYWSMVMIEPLSEALTQTAKDQSGKLKMGIETKVRYGIQIVTNIGESGAPRIKFLDKKLFTSAGRTVLQMDIENTGERWLSPTVWVELYDHQGMLAGRFQGDKKRIYPGCSVRHRVDLTGAAPGKYKALVVADNGDQYVFGARYDLGIQ
jgi:hypothetical protein